MSKGEKMAMKQIEARKATDKIAMEYIKRINAIVNKKSK